MLTNLAQVLQQTRTLQEQLTVCGLTFREPPAPPTSCCGRGCNGCVWEGFYEASDGWIKQAQQLLSQP